MQSSRQRPFWIVVTAIALAAWSVAGLAVAPAAADSGSVLTLYAEPATMTNGDDFATTVLGDPWDMDKRRDIGWEENFSDIQVTDGIWSGRIEITNPVAGPTGYVFPLFQGFGSAWPEGKIGANFPIDTSRYTRLSYRMYVSDRRVHAVYWTHEVDWPDGTQFFAFREHEPPGWKIYTFDLTESNGDPNNEAGAWQAAPYVYGLRIDPMFSSTSSEVKIDWIRLTDPSTSPRYPLSWEAQGLEEGAMVEVCVDTDNHGYDGSPLAEVAASEGNYEVLTSILAGGDYYFYLRSGEVVSNYVGPLTINNPPVVRWDLGTVGTDYATEVLGDPWDMNAPSDLENLGELFLSDEYYPLRQFYDWEVTNGIFSATADSNYAWEHYSSEKQSDVQVWLHIDPDRPVDSSVYRYLVFRMKVDDPEDHTISQRVRDGWVARIVWWNEEISEDGFCTDEIVLYEDWNTYIVDLQARDQPVGYNPYPAQRPWRQMGHVLHLRIDPLEVSQDTRFHIDEVRLLSEPVVDGMLSLNLGIGDPDGQAVTLTYYYDDDASGFDGSPLPLAGAAPSSLRSLASEQPFQVFVPIALKRPRAELPVLLDDQSLTLHRARLSTASLDDGTYYIYACASDGIAETCRYLPRRVNVTH